MTSLVEVIPYMKRVNKNNGAVISKFSVIPYGSSDDWERVVSGYTWRHTDYRGTMTEGMHRVPAKTVEEANEFALEYQKRIPNVDVVLG